MRTLTAKQIHDAIQCGEFVFIGNRQPIDGVATRHHTLGEAAPGNVWVNRSVLSGGVNGSGGWTEVKLSQVSIDQRNGGSMSLKGKRANGRPSHVGGSKRKKAAARSNNDNQELPGIEVDQRRIAAIEKAQEAKEEASKALSVAHEDFDAADKRLVSVMESNGFDAENNPVYTRQPWGSVVLQQKGEVKVTAKFTAGTKKAKKKASKEESVATEE
jgi:hypothetical protein